MSDLEKMREALHLLASTLFGPIKEDQTHYLRRLAFLGGDDLKVYAVKPTNDGGILTVKDARKIWEALQIEAARPEALCIPEGWKLVPPDATDEMVKAARIDETSGTIRGIWKDMFFAAPSGERSRYSLMDDLKRKLAEPASVPSPLARSQEKT